MSYHWNYFTLAHSEQCPLREMMLKYLFWKWGQSEKSSDIKPILTVRHFWKLRRKFQIFTAQLPIYLCYLCITYFPNVNWTLAGRNQTGLDRIRQDQNTIERIKTQSAVIKQDQIHIHQFSSKLVSWVFEVTL